MENKHTDEHPTEIVDEGSAITLDELCSRCGVNIEWITELIEHGAIDAVEPTEKQWRFTQVTVLRVAKAKRLERDLAVNTPGLALALELLDQIDDLRARLKAAESNRS